MGGSYYMAGTRLPPFGSAIAAAKPLMAPTARYLLGAGDGVGAGAPSAFQVSRR